MFYGTASGASPSLLKNPLLALIGGPETARRAVEGMRKITERFSRGDYYPQGSTSWGLSDGEMVWVESRSPMTRAATAYIGLWTGAHGPGMHARFRIALISEDRAMLS
jgi:hypothetical protein